jgi:pentafunctional AROM polypeptide
MFGLLRAALRAGVECLDVEAAWGEGWWGPLLAEARGEYGGTLVLGSHHVPGRLVGDGEAEELARMCGMGGRADAVKLILSCEGRATAGQALACAGRAVPDRPVIAMALGIPGRHSRVLNPRFTPVTHPSLPSAAAPGQLSSEEIMAARVAAGLAPRRTYHIVGRGIPYTLSPALHQRAIDACGLPHAYVKNDVESLGDFVGSEEFKAPSFGGSSVTIPYKVEIMEHLDWVEESARELGAVNTVVAEYDKGGGRVLKGYNTDVDGIYIPVEGRLRGGEDRGGQ